MVKKNPGDVDLEQSKYRIRKVSSHQRGNQNPQNEGQTTQWSKRKGQTTIYKTLHRTLISSNTNLTNNGGELRCPGRVSSSCSTRDIRRVTSSNIEIVLDTSMRKSIQIS